MISSSATDNVVYYVDGFHGIIDDVRVYNRALSAAEVDAVYVAGLEPEAPVIVTPPESPSPSESAVSPAWVEGTVVPSATSVTVSVDGGASFDATRMGRTPWFADNAWSGGAALGITLSETAATTVDVTAGFEGGVSMSASRTITWIPTYIDSDSAQTVTIRRGDSLLLTAYEEGGTDLEIDADGDGVFELIGANDQMFPVLYDTAGEYVAEAKIDGISVGTLTVVVIDVDLSTPIACQVGFTRQKDVPITPASYAVEVIFSALDTSLLDIPTVWLGGTGATVHLTALQPGTPVLTARLGGDTGPIVAYREVDEFALDNTAAYRVNILDMDSTARDRSGQARLTMEPLVPDLDLDMWLCSPGVTFDSGVTEIAFSTTDFEPQPDGSGTYVYRLHLAPGYDAICVNMDVSQWGSDLEVTGRRHGDNGGVCEAKATLFFVPDEKNQRDGEGNYTYSESFVVNEGEPFLVDGATDGRGHGDRYKITVTSLWDNVVMGTTDPPFACPNKAFVEILTGSYTLPAGETSGEIKVELDCLEEGAEDPHDELTMQVMKADSFTIVGPDYVCVNGSGTYEAWECSEETNGVAMKVDATWTVTAGAGRIDPDGPLTASTFTASGVSRSLAVGDVTLHATSDDKSSQKNLTVVELEITSPANNSTSQIDATPAMPNISCTVTLYPAALGVRTIEWEVTVLYADGTGHEDTEVVPGSAPSNDTFTPAFPRIIGTTGQADSVATAEATLVIGGVECVGEVVFQIRGTNPNQAAKTAALAAVTGTAPNITGTGNRSVTMSSTLVYNVARHESGQTPPQQFDGNGIPILAGNDRGMMQINVQWGNVTLFAWNWVRNVEEGRRLLKDAVRESIQYVRNRYLEHPTLPDLTDVQCRRNGLSQYNSPNFYYGPNGDFTGWVRLSHPGVTYSDAIITRDPNE